MKPAVTVTLFLFTLAAPLTAFSAPVAAGTLPPNGRLAIIGDSITEQKLYSRYIEAYLVACAGRSDVRVFQFGWGGETANGFANRAANDLAVFHPTTATLCYGMNDGSYRPFNEGIGKNYETNMRRVLKALQENGVKHVVVGTPGAVDTFYFKNGSFGSKPAAEGYNDNLRQLGEIGKKLAAEFQQPFADVHQPMVDAMVKTKPVFGEKYDVGGADGVHPNANGHLIMAGAFLKGLGCDGDLGTITLDMKGIPAATEGHKVLAGTPGSVELSSTRYPFCLQGDGKSPGSTRSIAPYIPFHTDLNRLTLKVTGLDAAKAKVEWGTQSKEFTKEQLGAGINLAAEFSTTPFDANFSEYLNRLGSKQNFETMLIKQLVTNFRAFKGEAEKDKEVAAAFATLGSKLAARQQVLDDDARKALEPVKHTIKVTPL